ncbi:MAG: glycosyltransferase [Pseudomonadota bacterium]
MRVLIVFSSSELGGAERSLSRMALASTLIDYKLATLKSEGPWCEWVRSQGVNPIVLGKGASHGRSGLFSSIKCLFKYLKVEPVDIIYVCGVRASLWIRLFKFLIPHTKIVHGVRWNPASDSHLDIFFRFVEKISFWLIDGWITNSKAAKKTLIDQCGISESKIQVIYNGIESIPVEPPFLSSRPCEILTIANLNPRKGHREFLEAIKIVVSKIPEAKFVFIGRDDMNGLIQQAIINNSLQDNVHCEGFCSDVTPWLQRARLFVLPSLWGEGCPTSILESFSFNVPVIAYAIDGVPELVQHASDGYVCEVSKTALLADYIIKLLKDVSLSEAMGVKGRSKIKNHYSLEASSNFHHEFFKKLIDDK